MTPYLLILFAIAVGVTITAYLRYAYANYPKSWRWELLLIGSPFIVGSIMGILLFTTDFRGGILILIAMTLGFAFVVLFRFFSMYRLQHLIPKRRESDDNDRE
jgi:hypothetical protein